MRDLQGILDELPMAVWVRRVPGGEVEYANRLFRSIIGIAPVSQSGIADSPATYGIRDRTGQPYPVDRLPFSRVVASGVPVEVDDIVIHRPDGVAVHMRVLGTPLVDAEGRITHVIVTGTDITKEVEARRQRDTMETRLMLAVNHGPIVIWATDRDGVITLSEGAGLASLGVKSGELVGKNVFDLYGDHPTIPGYLRRALGGESFSYTVEVPTAVYDSFVTPLRDDGGDVIGLVGLSHDVTEIRRLQENAIQNDRAIAVGTLAASVAHEVNNPLTYVLTHLQRARQELDAIERALVAVYGTAEQSRLAGLDSLRAHLDLVKSGAERIARITGDLRTFSRADDQKPVSVDAASVVRSVLRLVGKEAEARARLRLDLQPTEPVRADEPRLVQVVLNLIVNALQATQGRRPEEMEILVRTRNDGDRVLIEVRDSGPGVPAADRARIFEPFFTTKTLGEGTGLGLFVSRNIVRALGGEITVEDHEGGGALFRVSLPAARREVESPAAASQPSAEPAAKDGTRVLIVDDDDLVARALSEALHQAGYEVTSVNDGWRALDMLVSDRAFDLVFCDLMMPGLTGMDLALALKDRAPSRLARMVFMTGGAFTPQARAFLRARPGLSVDKPFDVVAETVARLRGFEVG